MSDANLYRCFSERDGYLAGWRAVLEEKRMGRDVHERRRDFGGSDFWRYFDRGWNDSLNRKEPLYK